MIRRADRRERNWAFAEVYEVGSARPASTSSYFWSITVIVPLVFTHAIPLSMALAPEYISLLPMVWPVLALSTKYGLSSFAILRSKRSSFCEFS